jgi:hypothetical protein
LIKSGQVKKKKKKKKKKTRTKKTPPISDPESVSAFSPENNGFFIGKSGVFHIKMCFFFIYKNVGFKNVGF